MNGKNVDNIVNITRLFNFNSVIWCQIGGSMNTILLTILIFSVANTGRLTIYLDMFITRNIFQSHLRLLMMMKQSRRRNWNWRTVSRILSNFSSLFLMTLEIQIFLHVLRKMKILFFQTIITVITRSATVAGWSHIWT